MDAFHVYSYTQVLLKRNASIEGVRFLLPLAVQRHAFHTDAVQWLVFARLFDKEVSARASAMAYAFGEPAKVFHQQDPQEVLQMWKAQRPSFREVWLCPKSLTSIFVHGLRLRKPRAPVFSTIPKSRDN